jgi:hypothetical protein
MMEAQYKTRGGQLTIKVQAENQKELFKLIAGVQNFWPYDHVLWFRVGVTFP